MINLDVVRCGNTINAIFMTGSRSRPCDWPLLVRSVFDSISNKLFYFIIFGETCEYIASQERHISWCEWACSVSIATHKSETRQKYVCTSCRIRHKCSAKAYTLLVTRSHRHREAMHECANCMNPREFFELNEWQYDSSFSQQHFFFLLAICNCTCAVCSTTNRPDARTLRTYFKMKNSFSYWFDWVLVLRSPHGYNCPALRWSPDLKHTSRYNFTKQKTFFHFGRFQRRAKQHCSPTSNARQSQSIPCIRSSRHGISCTWKFSTV